MKATLEFIVIHLKMLEMHLPQVLDCNPLLVGG
jgi:hypothetical protein